MANQITKTNPADGYSGTRTVITIEGYKRSATATGGGSDYIEDSALVGVAEENIVAAGTSHATSTNYYDGAGTRNVIRDDTQTFLTKCLKGMLFLRTDTGAVVDSNCYGAYGETRLRGNAFPANKGYEVHGFAKQAPTDYLKHFQLNSIRIISGTGAGQKRLIKCVVDNGTTVKLYVAQAWETAPDNTSVYVIAWSWMDIIYAAIANSWANVGQILWNAKGNLPIAIELNAEVVIGANGTPTYFGFVAPLLYTERRSAVSGWGGEFILVKAEAIVDNGEYDPISGNIYKPPMLLANLTMAWESGGQGGESGCEGNLYGGLGQGWMMGNGLYGGITNSVKAKQGGEKAGYHTVDSMSGGGSVGEWEKKNMVILDAYDSGFMKIIEKAISEWNGKATHNSFPAGDFQGTNLDYMTRYKGCMFDINVNAPTPNGKTYSRGVVRDESYGYGDWNSILFNVPVFAKATDEVGNLLEGVALNIKDVIGTQFSYVDSGSVLNEDIGRTDTTFEVTNRQYLAVDDVIRLNWEWMKITAKAGDGTGTGDITVTREYGYSKVWRKTLHKANTETFDNKIYKKSTVLSEANGEFAEQELTVGFQNPYASQVYRNGKYHTAKTVANWSNQNKEPAGVTDTYWTVDSGDVPCIWRNWRHYNGQAVSAAILRSPSEFNPWTFEFSKQGYEPDDQVIEIDLDAMVVYVTAKLRKSPSFLIDSGKRIKKVGVRKYRMVD